MAEANASGAVDKKKTPWFLIASASMILVGMVTPKIIASVPLVIAFICGLICIFRKERFRWWSIAPLLIAITIFASIQKDMSELNKAAKDLEKASRSLQQIR